MEFYNKELETISRKDLEILQLKKLQNIVNSALKTPFYKERLNGIGIKNGLDLTKLSDLQKIPYTTKDDLREAFPYGLLSVSKDEVVRLHASSGTTGVPTTIYFTQKDIDRASELVARSCFCTGSRKSDVFQNVMTYGLFTGGLMLHYGAEKLGMLVIPASSGNTSRQLKLLKDYESTVIHATPSYLLHLYSKMDELGYSLKDLKLKKAYIGAEPHSEDIRKKIEKLFNIDAYNSYGLSEMSGPGVAFECEYKNGMHLWEDYYIAEIIDRDTLQPIEDGKDGELVLTNLEREATPLLRYRTKDLTRIITGKCECGRTHRRIERIKGRTDDMLIINGVNIFPSQIEEIVMKTPEVHTNYQIILRKAGELEKIIVKIEVTNDVFSDDTRDLEKLKAKIQNNIQSVIFVKPVIELHEPGSLPVQQGKAIRVFDER